MPSIKHVVQGRIDSVAARHRFGGLAPLGSDEQQHALQPRAHIFVVIDAIDISDHAEHGTVDTVRFCPRGSAAGPWQQGDCISSSAPAPTPPPALHFRSTASSQYSNAGLQHTQPQGHAHYASFHTVDAPLIRLAPPLPCHQPTSTRASRSAASRASTGQRTSP